MDNFGGGTISQARAPFGVQLAGLFDTIWAWMTGLVQSVKLAFLAPVVQAQAEQEEEVLPPEGQIWKNYVLVGGQRVAVREHTSTSSEVYFLLGDHLGSTSVTTDASGTIVSEIRYTAYGEERYSSGTTPTNYLYTGQLSKTETIGLYYYNARWYDPYLNHFVQADTIVPIKNNALAWDRFAYVLFNPIIFIDPSGHIQCTDDGYCGKSTAYSYWNRVISQLQSSYGISFTGKWSQEDKIAALSGAVIVSGALAKAAGMSSITTFKAVFGELTFSRSTSEPGYWGEYYAGTITFYAGAREWRTLVPHELGHAFNARIANNGGTTPYNTLGSEGIWTANGIQIAGYERGYVQAGTGQTCGNGTEQCYDRNGKPISANSYHRRTSSGLRFYRSVVSSPNEDFADMFANWATGGFTRDKYGQARDEFMTTNMAEWIESATGGR